MLTIAAHPTMADNNLVTTLLDVPLAEARSYAFTNPRHGWVFIADGNDESMRLLKRGAHAVDGSAGRRLVVRAIPEIVHAGLGYRPSPFLQSFPRYDVAHLERIGVFRNANVILERNPDPDFDIDAWRASGRQVRVRASSEEAPAEEIYAYWAGHRGMSDPYDGIQMSEYDGWANSHHLKDYPLLIEAARRIAADPRFAGKRLVPYTVAMYNSPQSKDFLRTLFASGHLQACERYLPAPPTLEKVREELHWMGWIIDKYRTDLPGSEGHSILALGYMSAPPETLDNCPDTDYLVYMDMQMHAVATEPPYRGLYGVMWYHAAYADEEVLRWSVRLLRHYCIEGHADRLSKDPYVLPHLANGDFADGTTGWTLEPAAPDSMSVGEHPGLSYLQTRYPRVDQGRTFLRTRRSAERPNVFRQTIRALAPGRTYALRMMVCDHADLVAQRDRRQEHCPLVRIDGVQMLPAASFREAFASGRAGHGYERFDRANNLWVTYQRVVFRATAAQAELRVSDWSSATEPGGPAGQELAFNYLGVRPCTPP